MKLRVGVLFGGRSAEHEISILSARTVVAALDRRRFEAVPIGIGKDGRFRRVTPERLLAGAASAAALPPGGEEAFPLAPGGAPLDVVFPVLHGPLGEDGAVQGLLELAGVPYVGSGILGSAVGMDKEVQKRLLRDAGLEVAPFRVVSARALERRPGLALALARELGFPLYVKPACLGSSVGVTRVASPAALPAAVDLALRFDERALLEAEVRGRELEVAVLGEDPPRASPVGEIAVRGGAFYSYEKKYLDPSGAELLVPAPLPPGVSARARAVAVAAFEALSAEGFARVDLFLDGERLVVNELNTLPGMTARSMAPRLFEAGGLPLPALLARLVELAVERHRRREARL